MSKNFQKGAAAVELGLLLPLLILMLDGVVEVGVLLHNQSVLVTASNMAARAGIANSTPKLSTNALTTIAKDYCDSHLISINAATPAVIQVVQAVDPVFPHPLRILATYTHQGFLVNAFVSGFQVDPAMTATTVMYNE